MHFSISRKTGATGLMPSFLLAVFPAVGYAIDRMQNPGVSSGAVLPSGGDPTKATPRVVSVPAAAPPSLQQQRALAQAVAKAPARSAPSITTVVPSPSGSEIVGKMLAPQPSSPDVPLPRRDLESAPSGSEPGDKPQIYGRTESGGGFWD
jgi:hypothetical protein